MQAILLAAGMGTRLGEMTHVLPKTLIPVNGHPICHYILGTLMNLGITKFIVVTGFEKEKLIKELNPFKDNIQFIHNPDYNLGNLISLQSAFEKINEDFLIMNADHVFDERILSQVIHKTQDQKNIFIVCDDDRALTDDDMKVALNNKNRLAIMKKTLTAYDLGYIGLTYIPKSLYTLYKQTASDVLQREGKGSHVEMVLNAMAEEVQIEPFITRDLLWFEIDTKSDLELASNKIHSMRVTHHPQKGALS